MKKAVVFYHANCMDGFGSAWAFKTSYERTKYETVLWHPSSYNRSIPKEVMSACEGSDVFIFDFSFPNDVFGQIREFARSVTWIDHHKTAFESYLGRYEKGMSYHNNDEGLCVVLDDNASGCMLVWDFFHTTEVAPLWLCAIEDRDLWLFKREGTKEVCAAIGSYPMKFDVWSQFQFNELLSEGKTIRRHYEQQLSEVIRQARPIALCGFNGYCVNTVPMFNSEAGSILAQKEGSAFGLTWFENSREEILVSLRSVGDFDVSKIAKFYGGGGHRNAAGFTMSAREFKREVVSMS